MADNKTIPVEDKNDWRQLCAAAATEQDSAKLSSLVNRIIDALDERRPRLRPTEADRWPGN